MTDQSRIVEQAFAAYLRNSFDPQPDEDTASDLRHAFFSGSAFMNAFADALITAAEGDRALVGSTFDQVLAELRSHRGDAMPTSARVSFHDLTRSN